MNVTGESIHLPTPQEIAGLTDDALLKTIGALQRGIDRLQAEQVHMIGHLNRLHDGDRSDPDELAP